MADTVRVVGLQQQLEATADALWELSRTMRANRLWNDWDMEIPGLGKVGIGYLVAILACELFNCWVEGGAA